MKKLVGKAIMEYDSGDPIFATDIKFDENTTAEDRIMLLSALAKEVLEEMKLTSRILTRERFERIRSNVINKFNYDFWSEC